MFDQLYPEELNNSLSQSVLRPEPPEPEPGALTGVGSALIDSIPYAYNTTASAFAGMYAIGQKGAEEFNTASMKKPPSLRGDIIGASGTDQVAKTFRQAAETYKAGPATVGIAGQIVHGVASSLIKAGVYTLTTGPAAPVMFGLDLGINRQQELMDQGVDPETATNTGAISAIAGAAGLKVAPALGATRLQSAAIGASINPLMTVGEIGGIHAILEHADYPKIAAQYNAFDPMSLAVSSLTGAAFGAVFHQGGARLSPDEHAAALTLNEAQTRDADALTPRGDINAANAAADEQVSARQALDAGQPVEVNGGLPIDGAVVDEIQSSVKESVINGQNESEYHPAITSLASDLEKGGGIAYTFDENGTITGRTSSVNPDWYKDGAFKILGKDGEELKTSPTVQDIKTAVDRYNAGEKVTSRQQRILSALSDVAKIDEEFHNSKFHAEQTNLASEISSLVKSAQELGLGKSINDAIARGDLNTFDDVMAWRDDINDMIAERNIAKQEHNQPITEPVDNADQPTNDYGGFTPETPEQVGAMDYINKNPDAIVRFDDQDYKASDLLNEAAGDEAQAKTDATAFEAAITCAMRFMS